MTKFSLNWVLTVLAAASVSACAGGGGGAHSSEVIDSAKSFSMTQPAKLRPYANALYLDGERNAVLNFARLGLAALEIGQFKLAKHSFDDAITRIESIHANDKNAKEAQSKFSEESVKDFKGDPYERAMIYYYRGLLYAADNDFENARASFLAADRHDSLSFTQDEKFAGDFGMVKYLASWASSCAGDSSRATELLSQAADSDPLIRKLSRPEQPHLVLVDVGTAPIKYGDGEHEELLRYKPGEVGEVNFAIYEDETVTTQRLSRLGDISYQARTRGGREVDAILAGKAQFKDSAQEVGDVSMVSGMSLLQVGAQTQNQDLSGLGLVGIFGGLIAQSVSNASKPKADIRAWDTLPSRVYWHGQANPFSEKLSISRDGGKTRQSFALRAGGEGCSLAWGRTHTSLSQEFGGFAAVRSEGAFESGREDRNLAFRRMLKSNYLNLQATR